MPITPKCRAKNHQPGGCGDPRCPEGLYLNGLFDHAVQSGELDRLLQHAEKDALRPVRLQGTSSFSADENRGYWEMIVENKNTGEKNVARVTPNRTWLREQAEKVDRTSMIDFENLDELRDYIEASYGDAVQYSVYEETPSEEWGRPWAAIHVSDMHIDGDLRGLGISKHIKQLICRYADQKGLLITGTPSNRGDGSTRPDLDLDHTERALAHRNRLVQAYYRNGYVDNPCWSEHSDHGDYLTKEHRITDPNITELFTPEAKSYLDGEGQYIRFPNGEVPKAMLKRGAKFDPRGHRNPPAQPTRQAAAALQHKLWDEFIAKQAAEKEARRAKRAAKAAAAA